MEYEEIKDLYSFLSTFEGRQYFFEAAINKGCKIPKKLVRSTLSNLVRFRCPKEAALVAGKLAEENELYSDARDYYEKAKEFGAAARMCIKIGELKSAKRYEKIEEILFLN